MIIRAFHLCKTSFSLSISSKYTLFFLNIILFTVHRTETKMTQYSYLFTIAVLAILLPASTLAQLCSNRPTGCCPGRDDSCNLPHRGSLCYCDAFCERTKTDCCPDFFNYCLGQEVVITTPQPKGKAWFPHHFVYIMSLAYVGKGRGERGEAQLT